MNRSPPEQHQQLHLRKRANEPAVDHHGRPIGGRETSASPPASKRRRVDVEPTSSERNGSYTGSENVRHHRNISSALVPPQQQILQQQNNTRPRVSQEPPRIQPAPTASSATGGAPLKQELNSPPSVLVQSPATPSVHSNVTPTSGSIAITDPPSSFSRRISSSAGPSTGRPTPRKLPPSRLNFQSPGSSSSGGGGSGHAYHGSLAAVPPSIRSAPPIPVHRDGQGPMQMQMQTRLASSSTTSGSGTHDGTTRSGEGAPWLTNHPSTQSRTIHPPHQSSQGTAAIPSSHSHSRSHSLQQAAQQQPSHPAGGPSDSATPRASTFSRDRDGWPTVPTPTSLRLGSRPIVPPPLYNATQAAHSPGPGITRFPTTPSTRGHAATAGVSGGHGTPSAGRFPPTPGLVAGAVRPSSMLSPIPPLGQGNRAEAGVDRAKFLQIMSEMYDRVSRAGSSGAHNAQRECGCLSAEEVEKRFRERDVEIATLKQALGTLLRESGALRRALAGGAASVVSSAGKVDGDGDVPMAVEKVPSTSAPAAGDMEVDARSRTPSNQPLPNGDVTPGSSIKHHRYISSEPQNSAPTGPLGSEKGTASTVPIPPAVPAVPRPPIGTSNGKTASTTPSPLSTREDTPTAGMNGVEVGLKKVNEAGEIRL